MSPMQSKAQNAAMHAAASGNSTLGIPKSVGADFVNASHGENVSALPQKVKGPSSPLEASTGLPSGKKTWRGRGRRSRGNGGSIDAHQEAKGHLANAQAAATPKASMDHLFKALSSLKKAK
jgi:hypothetical protein